MRRRSLNKYIKCDDFVILKILSETYGQFDFIIDKDDYERCSQYSWCVHKTTGKYHKPYFYACNNHIGLLHRFIMNAPQNMLVDHINSNTLDNRKTNLRICTKSENNMNRYFEGRNKSNKIGVMYNDKLKTPKWMAYISLNKKRKHLGYFENYEDAVNARLEAEKRYYGDFAPNNVSKINR